MSGSHNFKPTPCRSDILPAQDFSFCVDICKLVYPRIWLSSGPRLTLFFSEFGTSHTSLTSYGLVYSPLKVKVDFFEKFIDNLLLEHAGLPHVLDLCPPGQFFGQMSQGRGSLSSPGPGPDNNKLSFFCWNRLVSEYEFILKTRPTVLHCQAPYTRL